ncbi:hypothetical protein BAUCODRAFT_390870 [Baudoinia panamericana UAMH 10762]|uniref:DUF7918 domain-containing protein n=1 Tax=Baudoinia panamericana (strain UAMH 10762) TaxID=717646 RepID=M2NI94_BAUPA|nr:uncharacterized protein BAUCODRAFT_390870 [Baudoinia panamericana UAMH 10762]EMC99084.1 hypothetical protein BAUCODRAFT_390870 [Baudoinia panamericana UAMH 10762]
MQLIQLPGLEVNLCCEGKTLPEYDDESFTPQANKNTKYVEVVNGATFSVEFRFLPNFPYITEDTQIQVKLDGKFGRANLLSPSQMVAYRSNQIDSIPSYNKGSWTKQMFKFADLSTDDHAVKASQMNVKKALALGTVTAEVICVKVGAPAHCQPANTFASEGKIPEKALKGRAMSIQAELSKAVACEAATYADVTYPYGHDPIATFTFKYRSRRDLQIEGIIPRSPSPVPLEDRDPDSLSAEEARELVRRLRAQREDLVRVKREGAKRQRSATVTENHDDDDGDDVTISETRSRKRSRPSADSGVELVDLTGD